MRATALALILAVFPIMLFSRLRLRETPLERDEGEYAYAGQLILQGIPPYSLACNMKLPGTYAAYAAIMAVFGQTIGGIRLGLLLINAATVLLLYLLGRRLFPTRRGTGGRGGLRAALLRAGGDGDGGARHALRGASPRWRACCCCCGAMESGRATAFFWSGVLFGVAFLMKQHGIFFAMFGAAWLLWKHPGGWMRTARRLAIFGAAAALPFALTCLILWMGRRLPEVLVLDLPIRARVRFRELARRRHRRLERPDSLAAARQRGAVGGVGSGAGGRLVEARRLARRRSS